jgi:hypothetical protein
MNHTVRHLGVPIGGSHPTLTCRFIRPANNENLLGIFYASAAANCLSRYCCATWIIAVTREARRSVILNGPVP